MLITDKPLRKVAALDWMLLTNEKSDASSEESIQFEGTTFDKLLICKFKTIMILK